MISLPQQAREVLEKVTAAGFEAWIVGGSVRDLLMGKTTKGFDFTTSAPPEEILKIFPDSFYDNQFGTVGIKIYKKVAGETKEPEIEDIFEITTYRSETGYSDHRHPDTVRWGKTLEEDLARRDFTINAIAIDGKRIIDPWGGQDDLDKKIIRTVGDPSQRFAEDALRMMRAIRIAAQLGFTIEERTLEAITKNHLLLSQIAMERIRDELLKILASDYASDAILVLKTTKLLSLILPELEAAFKIEQKSPKRHHIYDVGTHCLMALKFCPSKNSIVRLATLLHDIGKPQTFHKDANDLVTFYNHEVIGAHIAKSIAQRLRLSKHNREKIITLVRWHQFSVDERQTDSAIRRFIRHVGKENLEDMLALRIGDRLGGGARETSWRLELYKKRLSEVQQQPFSPSDLAIDGHDVMKELDIPPGPFVGKAIMALFSLVETGELANEREALITKLRELQPTILTS